MHVERYTGPPEYFTCYACLWGSPELQRVLSRLPANWLAQNVNKLRLARFTYEREHGQTPHPCVLLAKALAEDSHSRAR